MSEIKKLITNIFNLDQQLRKQPVWSMDIILFFNTTTTALLKEIVSKFGIPTPAKVGQKTADKFVVLLTHCIDLKFIKKIIDAEEFKNGTFKKENIAIAIDELLVKNGKKQRFGTVLRAFEKDGKILSEPMPMVDPKNVNKRRARFGIETTLEQHIIHGNKLFKRIKR